MTRLTPVLELQPWTYATKERPSPNRPVWENPEGWHRYWEESLADSGLVGLTPLAPSPWHVPTSRITEPSMVRTILLKHLEVLEVTEWTTEQISAFDGGYVLEHGEAAIFPGCCGDLSNLREWERAAAHTRGDWEMVWIGHPWIFVRAEEDMLHFTHPSDRNQPAEAEAEATIPIPRGEVLHAIKDAQSQLRDFAQVLTSVLEDMRPPVEMEQAWKLLLGGPHPGLGREFSH